METRKRSRRARRRAASVAWTAAGLIVAVSLPGCALLAGPIDRAAHGAANAVNAYCDNFSADQRMQFGDRVRALAAPDSIDVTCN